MPEAESPDCETRKICLSLTAANHYLAQLNEQTAEAARGNLGAIAAFQVGSDDANALAQQLDKYPVRRLIQMQTQNGDTHNGYVRSITK